MTSHSLSTALAAALLAAAAGVQAQSLDSVNLSGPVSGSGEGRVGLAAIAGHQYLGSNERRASLFPTIDYRWASGWFAGVGNGVGYKFSSDSQWQYGLRLAADFGRKENRSSVLQGLGDIHARPEAGAFLNWQASRDVTLTSSVRYGAGNDRHGLLLDVGLRHGLQLATQWRLGMSLSATYANRNYMQSYFGITPEQSANSGYAVSAVGAGVRDVRLGSSLTYFITRDWAATLAVSATSLQGDAKDSVIVRERTPVTAVFAVGYRF